MFNNLMLLSEILQTKSEKSLWRGLLYVCVFILVLILLFLLAGCDDFDAGKHIISETCPHSVIKQGDTTWAEIMRVDEVNEGWGLEEGETAEQFAAMAYCVKFDFQNGSPGYAGDLYIQSADTPPAVSSLRATSVPGTT